MTKKIIVTLAILFTLIPMLILLNVNKTLVIGTNPAFPPFEYIGGKTGNEVVGFDIEMAKEIAKDMGRTLNIKVMDFSELIPALQEGKIDMAINAITITEGRQKLVDFSEPYYADKQFPLVLADDDTFDDIDTKESLGQHKRLGSRSGTTGVITAAHLAEDKPIMSKDTWQILINELYAKRLDALVVDGLIGRSLVAQYENLKILPIELSRENYGVAVKKNDKKMLSSVNKTIARLQSSGDYDELVGKYIDSYLLE